MLRGHIEDPPTNTNFIQWCSAYRNTCDHSDGIFPPSSYSLKKYKKNPGNFHTLRFLLHANLTEMLID